MRQSQLLLPTLKENPADADVASHRLMLRAGLIRQVAAGVYTWLPLGLSVLRNIRYYIDLRTHKTVGFHSPGMLCTPVPSFPGVRVSRHHCIAS